MPETEGKVTISIPEDLFHAILDSISGTTFHSVDDFVAYTLRIAIGKKLQPFSTEDEELVKARLRALGYL